MPARVLVIGLDAAEATLIEGWATAGRLPNLAALAARAASWRRANPLETLPGSIWPEPAVSALVSRRGGAHAGAVLGLESSAKSLGQIAGPVLGGVLFGASVAVPFWLASGLLLGLAPIFAWSGRRTQEPPGGREAKGKLAFRRQEAR